MKFGELELQQEIRKVERETIQQLERLADLYTDLASWEPKEHNVQLHNKVNDLIWRIKTYGKQG